MVTRHVEDGTVGCCTVRCQRRHDPDVLMIIVVGCRGELSVLKRAVRVVDKLLSQSLSDYKSSSALTLPRHNAIRQAIARSTGA